MKKSLYFFLILSLIFSLTACQENPKGSIIVHKDMDNLISKAQEDGESKVEAADIVNEVAKQFETYQTTIENENLGVTVNVNAKVDVPQVDSLNVYRVKKKLFDQEFVDKVRQVLMGDKPVYETAALNQTTKADLELKIGALRESIRKTEEKLAAGAPPDVETDLSMEELQASRRKNIERLQDEVDQLQKQYETAPAETDPARYPSDGQLHTHEELCALYPELYSGPSETWGKRGSLNIVADASDGKYQILEVENGKDTTNALYYYATPEDYFYHRLTAFKSLDPEAYGEIAPGNSSIPDNFFRGDWFIGDWFITDEYVLRSLENDTANLTEEEAVRRAKEFLTEIGLGAFALEEGGFFNEIAIPYTQLSNGDLPPYYRPCYILRFYREMDGVLLTQASGQKIADKEHAEDYRARYWPGEALEVRVNDAGIVGFAYRAPIEVTETVVENAALKPFSEVKDTFEKMICIINADEQNVSRIDIDRVRLSYTRISEKDDFDSGLIVPVWSFEGKIETAPRGEEDFIRQQKTGAIMAINAIDGTVINGQLGY